jgi:(p)ppGpp synthase/HD superfamily hydrolase
MTTFTASSCLQESDRCMGAADKEGEWHTMADAELELRAAELASQAHEGQVDKQGRNYFAYHLLPIAESLRPFGSLAYVAGLLHDIIEDTPMTYAGLTARGFPRAVVAAVRSVTRQVGEPYGDLIERAAADPLGRLVKLADNWHNLSSLDSLMDGADRDRLRLRYEQARAVLERSVISPPPEAALP